MQETQSLDDMSTSLFRLAALGRKYPQRCFTNLNQYLTKDLLRVAFHQTRKDGAAGVDGQTAEEYTQELEANLESLLRRAKEGSYYAPPVKRGYIPKEKGQRKIGIPCFEDKVLQRAIVMILEKLYEPIFHQHSFGYRPGKSTHQADQWFEEQVKPRLIAPACLIRFADDAVLIMRNEKDSRRVMAVLPKRFNRFGLRLHPEKTCVTVFKPRRKNGINFLGFTHYWKQGRRGGWGIHRKTMKSRFARSVKAIKPWCRVNRHLSIPEQYHALCRKVRGHYAYFGVSGNSEAIRRFRYVVERVWVKWLRRRSQRHRLNWDQVDKLLKIYPLPAARLVTTKPANVMS